MKEIKWFAVYTLPKWERKVTELLEKKKIKAYCPLQKGYKEWGDKRRVVSDPLFRSHVFVCIEEKDFNTVTQTRGVLGFFYWLGKPAVISEEEIKAIRRFLNDYPDVRLEKTFVRPDESIKYVSNPLILRKGNILEVLTSTVKVTLPSLGHTLIADVRKDVTEENIAYIEEAQIRV